MGSNREQKSPDLITQVITRFQKKSSLSINDLMDQFQSARVEQGYQPFYALCNRIMNSAPNNPSVLLGDASLEAKRQIVVRQSEADAVKKRIQSLKENTQRTPKEEILLAFAYQFGLGEVENIPEAKKHYLLAQKHLSQEDSILRGIVLGQLAEIGLRTPDEDKEKNSDIDWATCLKDAIALGNLRARMELGISKLSAAKTLNNRADIQGAEQEGMNDIHLAAEQGYNGARCCLFFLPRNTMEDGLNAAASGSLLALVRLGEIYQNDLNVMAQHMFSSFAPYVPLSESNEITKILVEFYKVKSAAEKDLLLVSTLTEETPHARRAKYKLAYRGAKINTQLTQEIDPLTERISNNCETLFTEASRCGEWRATLSLYGLWSEYLDASSFDSPENDLQKMRIYHKAFEQLNCQVALGPELGVAPSLVHRTQRFDLMRKFAPTSQVYTDIQTNHALTRILDSSYEKFKSCNQYAARLYAPWQAERNDSFEACYHAAMILGLTDNSDQARARGILVDLAKRNLDGLVKLLMKEPNWQQRVVPLLGTEWKAKVLSKEAAANSKVASKPQQKAAEVVVHSSPSPVRAL